MLFLRSVSSLTAVVAMVLFFGFVAFSPYPAYALELEGAGDVSVSLVSAPELGDAAYLLRIDGVESAWAGRVFKVYKRGREGRTRYGFPYDLVPGSGVRGSRYYEVLVETGKVMRDGNLLRSYELHFPEVNRNDAFSVWVDLSAATDGDRLKQDYLRETYHPHPDDRLQ